jgi:UDP-glucuronate 4-epimerase
MRIIITGVAGFIGYSLAKHLLTSKKNIKILGIDNLNNYYSVRFKKKRLRNLRNKYFYFKKIDICDYKKTEKIFRSFKPTVVINLAAQAGVRYSIEFPEKYIKSNINGYFNIIELCKKFNVKRIIYASSSSVYGDSKEFPLKEDLAVKPKNIYALSKKFNEELSEIYSKLYNIQFIGLRLFTVYGEWGRPDMFFFKYLSAAMLKNFFYLNNYGNHSRDFTYIKDVVEIISALLFKKLKLNNSHEIYNICSSTPVKLDKIIKHLNKYVNSPKIIKRELQKADVIKTFGDNKKIVSYTNYKNFTKISEGIKKVSLWYLNNKNIF